jgi:hypothetical protein
VLFFDNANDILTSSDTSQRMLGNLFECAEGHLGEAGFALFDMGISGNVVQASTLSCSRVEVFSINLNCQLAVVQPENPG